MHLSTSLIVLAVTLSASAAPIRRADTDASADDVLVFRTFTSTCPYIAFLNYFLFLEFADVLEQLEATFYSQALSTFQDSDFTAAGFASAQIPEQLFTGIQNDEATHDSFLQVCLPFLFLSIPSHIRLSVL
jgi:hypothetical protein